MIKNFTWKNVNNSQALKMKIIKEKNMSICQKTKATINIKKGHNKWKKIFPISMTQGKYMRYKKKYK